eukprot:XP_011664143.1 PREDICTED: uncharacterized protein LOC105438255 isoform X1 [Strongylocentrotus purpuratus]
MSVLDLWSQEKPMASQAGGTEAVVSKAPSEQDVERLVEAKYKAVIEALQSTLQSTIRNQGQQRVAAEAPPPMERLPARQSSPQYTRYQDYRHTAYQRDGFPSPPDVHRSQDTHSSHLFCGDGNRERGHKSFSLPKSMVFDGRGSWQAFIAKFNLDAEAFGWTLSQRRNQLCWCLGGSASEYVSLLVKHEPHLGFADLVRKLEKRFASRDEVAQLQFNYARQQPGEYHVDWANRLMTLAAHAFADLPDHHVEKQVVHRFCQGCFDREAGHYAIYYCPRSLDEAIDLVRWFQHTHKAIHDKSRKDVRQTSVEVSAEEPRISRTATPDPPQQQPQPSRLDRIEVSNLEKKVDQIHGSVSSMETQVKSSYSSIGSQMKNLQSTVQGLVVVQNCSRVESDFPEPDFGQSGLDLPGPNLGPPGWDLPEPDFGQSGLDLPGPNLGPPGLDLPEPDFGQSGLDLPGPNLGPLGFDLPEPDLGPSRMDLLVPDLGQSVRVDLPEVVLGQSRLDLPQLDLGQLTGLELPEPNFGQSTRVDLPELDFGQSTIVDLPELDLDVPELNVGQSASLESELLSGEDPLDPLDEEVNPKPGSSQLGMSKSTLLDKGCSQDSDLQPECPECSWLLPPWPPPVDESIDVDVPEGSWLLLPWPPPSVDESTDVDVPECPWVLPPWPPPPVDESTDVDVPECPWFLPPWPPPFDESTDVVVPIAQDWPAEVIVYKLCSTLIFCWSRRKLSSSRYLSLNF